MGQEHSEDAVTAPRSPIRPNGRDTNTTDDRSRDSSDPPPPMPGTEGQVALARAERAVGKSREAMISADDATSIAGAATTIAGAAASDAAAARAGVTEIKAQIGNSPDPVLGVPGRGLFGVVATIVVDLHTLGSKFDALVTSLAADRAAADKANEARRGSTARVLGWFAAPTAGAIVGAVIAYLAGFHR
jgi:hypothetical protein